MRLTKKIKNKKVFLYKIGDEQIIANKLGQLEDILEKYNIDSPELLDKDLEHCHKLVYEYGQIEDELGVEFSMLDKICQNGVYCYKGSIRKFPFVNKRLGDIIYIQNSDVHIQFYGVYQEKRMGVSIMACIDYVYYTLPIEQYGITWALTKEELENGTK